MVHVLSAAVPLSNQRGDVSMRSIIRILLPVGDKTDRNELLHSCTGCSHFCQYIAYHTSTIILSHIR